jgi:N-acetylmuramoyl-L-alanine amidase
MTPAVLGAGFIALTQPSTTPAPASVSPPPPVVAMAPLAPTPLPFAEILATPSARDAMARVAYAEAGNQRESGLAAVVYTILNRLVDGRWGGSVEAVVDAPHQFEPVMRAGGTWRRLPPVTVAQEATVHTIVELALQGRLPDLTRGARFFQNERVVAARAAAGLAPPSLVAFGGAAPSAKIGDHTFYPQTAKTAPAATEARRRKTREKPSAATASNSIFFGENHAEPQSANPFAPPAPKP